MNFKEELKKLKGEIPQLKDEAHCIYCGDALNFTIEKIDPLQVRDDLEPAPKPQPVGQIECYCPKCDRTHYVLYAYSFGERVGIKMDSGIDESRAVFQTITEGTPLMSN